MMRTGCSLCRLRPSRLWKDSSEGAEETEVGRWFHSDTVWGKKVKEGRVLDLFLMQALCSSSPSVSVVEDICWVDVYEAFVDFVEHPRRICRLRCSRLVHFRFSSIDVTLPGDLSMYFFFTYLAARRWTFSTSWASFCL